MANRERAGLAFSNVLLYDSYCTIVHIEYYYILFCIKCPFFVRVSRLSMSARRVNIYFPSFFLTFSIRISAEKTETKRNQNIEDR